MEKSWGVESANITLDLRLKFLESDLLFLVVSLKLTSSTIVVQTAR